MGWCECSKLKAMQISSWTWQPNGHLSHLFHPLKGTKCTEGFQESLLRLSSSSCFGLPKLIRTYSASAGFQQVSSQGTPENTNKRRLEPLLLSVLLTQTKSLCESLCSLMSFYHRWQWKEGWATHTLPRAWRDVAWLKLIRCNIEFVLPAALTPHVELSSPLQGEIVKAMTLHF